MLNPGFPYVHIHLERGLVSLGLLWHCQVSIRTLAVPVYTIDDAGKVNLNTHVAESSSGNHSHTKHTTAGATGSLVSCPVLRTG